MGTFVVRDNFYLDGRPFQIRSGAMHYFRIPPAYWRDRLEKLRAMGCNTVETYVPWNLHEPRPGEYRFEDRLDVGAFLRLAQEIGLYAIVRPSPFICAEWEFGGLPAWLLAGEEIPLRSSRGPFLPLVARYYRRLFPILAPLQVDRGGPILLMQVENEFGSWGEEDPAYLEALRELLRAGDVTVPLITSDNLENHALDRGTVEGALATVNFGSGAAEKLEALRPYTHGGPLMVTEFWAGWFDAWGDDAHHRADARENAGDLEAILERGASVNIYMFHGGTNPGFYNGANYYDRLAPDVTSYDYDAPLSEDGSVTPKYEALRAVMARYVPVPPLSFSTKILRKNYGELSCRRSIGLFECLERLSRAVRLNEPRSMERLGQSYGYILYRTRLPAGSSVSSLELTGAADRAQIFLDGRPVLTLYDRELLRPHPVQWTLERETRLDILVENLGRVNYGPAMASQRKGIDAAVLADGRPLTRWEAWSLPMEREDVSRIEFPQKGEKPRGPAFYRFSFFADQPGDTFLDTAGWGKGCAFLNGTNLGRFWDVGPQRRLYIPAPLVRRGENTLVLFETEGRTARKVTLTNRPLL